MSVVKVIEILSNSPTSWEDATQQGVSHAAKTIRNIKSAYVSNFTAEVGNDGKITEYRVNLKISFSLDN
jgi:flavin-binding protein dodecin